ncbi:MAG: hypothetical protein L3K17_04060, partial [Thermoplasmata archaeon]|nr:hypothetical protein [Thermoplasmata archaeon]
MRLSPRILFLLTVGLSLLISPAGVIAQGGAPASVHASVADIQSRAPAEVPRPASDPAARAWNTTLASATPDVTPPPTSGLISTPPPAIPDTTPVVMYFTNASQNCCVQANFTAPVGTWDLIVLNYTGQAVNGVYDSSYRAYVDQSMVLFGTTPEYGTWTVLKDVTEYTSLFHGTFNLTFLLGAAVTNVYFLTSVSLAFYPVPNGGHAPPEPNLIVPLWFRVSITTSSPTIYVDTNLPTNVTNATMELYAYGFGPDEFWYSQEPGYRNVEVAVNGTSLASVLPFQYINTGGIDLFTWRPITGSFTLSDRPYELNETAALGLLEGPHNLTARLLGVTLSSDWIVAGSLLLHTDANATAASSTSYAWSAPAPTIHTVGSTVYDETATVTYSYSSLVGLPGGPVNVSLERALTYSSAVTAGQSWLTASWTNLTASEDASTNVTSAYSGGPVTQLLTTDFPLVMDIGDAFNQSSSNGGT